MAYTTFEHNGVRRVGEVRGAALVPLEGITEIGLGTPLTLLGDATRNDRDQIPVEEAQLLPVVPNPSKIFCVGLNYRAHVKETKRDLPTYPVLFPKFASNLIGPHDDIMLPPESSQVDYEGELVVVIGRQGRRIVESDALDHVLGYTVANDTTMRDFQYKTHQWMQGKAWDASTPVGPYVVTPDEIDLNNAGIRTTLNGETVQESDLSMLIFSIPKLIATISAFTVLKPGDLIFTGTPGGVGYRRDPQVFLNDGDKISVEIDGVGAVNNLVRAEPKTQTWQ
ncbi:fumarylacetoacetate hydrolase family protein [Rhodococcus sp. MSC1_016]|jgi:acylpyruvate hydrolase|uniref:fumarylacetoacetate hydrolase family protein n=1 Tax=Rhodococcus sp. MSC1_016 TaxID=2909266 RepID=UPI0020307AD4|nr:MULTISPECIES: fumarylacetoacetate hydrolase family protein [Rhodococcus]GLK33376.1 5-oxopent-3-ene-1,2,5-tricarboxylate decarboxylase [Rhodococcus wratislaviensis]